MINDHYIIMINDILINDYKNGLLNNKVILKYNKDLKVNCILYILKKYKKLH